MSCFVEKHIFFLMASVKPRNRTLFVRMFEIDLGLHP